MSKEAFPQLPPDARMHIENFPPDLLTVSRNQLLLLSHEGLSTKDYFGNPSPIPQAELGEQHQLPIDAVAEQMGRASQLLGFAHAELESSRESTQETGFALLAEKAKEIAIQSAKEAKAQGDSDVAVRYLESLLVIESLGSFGSPDQVVRSGVKTSRKLVSEGLANELVEATHKTFGLVAVQKYDTVPLNGIARSSPQLLRAATSLEFNDDFSDVKTGRSKGDLSDLSCGDLLALAKAADSEQANPPEAKELLEKALKNTEMSLVEPEELAETLTKASDHGLTEEVSNTMNSLRLIRRSGDSTYRINDPNTFLLDEVIVRLVSGGRLELAKKLMSSSSSESHHLKRAIQYLTTDDSASQQVISTLEGLRQEKQSELRQQLQSTGVSESTIEWVIDSTADPDSSAGITPEFWQRMESDPSLSRLLIDGGYDLCKTAEAVSTIESTGLSKYTNELLQRVLRIDEPEEVSEYLTSVRGAIDILNAQQTENEGSIDINRVMGDLVGFKDPVAALKATEELYEIHDLALRVGSLKSLLKDNHGNQELITFRKDDINGLILLRDYCKSVGIDVGRINHVSSSLLGSNNPLERAQAIVEALEIAGVTSETNDNLFTTIANKENPIKLGRAIQLFETQVPDLPSEVHKNLVRVIISSKDPEAESGLIVKTSRLLHSQNLDMEDLDEKSLLEVMRIIDTDGSGKKSERFCSNWKIKRECAQAYSNYLQPARESGNLESVNPEQRPKLVDLPEINARFEDIGIDPELAESILESWLTYSALKHKMYINNEYMIINPISQYIERSLTMQSEQLVKQIDALTDYVEQFGIDETKALINIFGIYNFIRYKPDQLHDQLLNWQSNKVPAKNVVVSARSDWNGAMSEAGKDFGRVLGEEELFCFEVNDRVMLAKVAIVIGNRERSAGRDPETTNALKNFVINAHANPEGLLLGTRRERLDATDYARDPLNGQRANTFRRHLGSGFRVILKACSTAGEVENGKNIAESISDHHGVRVEGSRINTNGSIIIEPDGTVRFNSGDVLATIYE